ncbi:cell wall-binding repeat-containing protein [Mobiluncus mulieris]|uniref:cell wall-binding repeat-containing protein n=1 Tax=Mobiluncus mulieris TaxID=2052 RepID=UPI002093C4D5|nr:cell wall-binding repeat-containing protein [Mobiluncus mulieris]
MMNFGKKMAVGVASAALVASLAGVAPAVAANEQEVPGSYDGMVSTDRFGGYDRVETAIKIAEKAFEKTATDVEVAYLASASDASAVDSAAAGHLSDGPIYLVSGDNRSAKAVSDSINNKFPNVQKIIAIGGEKAVAGSSLKTVADAVGVPSERLGGADRYETAVAIAERGLNYKGMSSVGQFYPKKVYLARGDNPVDALVSGVMDDAPVLLLGPDGSVPEVTKKYLAKTLPSKFVALGGEKAIPSTSFVKAEQNPVIRNAFTGNEDIKDAKKKMDEAEFLLKGVPGSKGVNPKIRETQTLSEEQLDVLRAQVAGLEAAQNAAQTAYETAVKTALGKTTAPKDTDLKTAETALKTAEDDLAKKEGLLKTRRKAEADINAAVKTYQDAIKAAGADTNAKDAAAVELKKALTPYITAYWDGSASASLSAMATSALADKLAGASGTLKSATEVAAVVHVAATAISGKAVFVKNKDHDYEAAFGKIIGNGTTAGLLKDANDAYGVEAVAQKKYDEAKAAYDNAKAAYDKAVADVEKTPAVKAAKANLEAAQKALDSVTFQIDNAGGGLAFMGYKRIEAAYSSIDGVYANGLNKYKAAIDKAVSDGANSQLGENTFAGFAPAVKAVKAAYGVDLTQENVSKFFAFKKNAEGNRVVFRANHAKLLAESDALVDQAKDLINEFYAAMQDGFNNGDMIGWFQSLRYTTLNNGIWGKADAKKRALVRDASMAVVDALLTGARDFDGTRYDESFFGLDKGEAFTINPRGFAGASRVAHILESIALNNRKSAESAYNEARVAFNVALDKVTPKRYDRLYGTDRFETSAAIAAYWRAYYVTLPDSQGGLGYELAKSSRVYLANGDTFIDAVAGGQLKQGPILLVNKAGVLTDQVKQRLAFARTDSKMLTVTALGGANAVSDKTLNDAAKAAKDGSLIGKTLFDNSVGKTLSNTPAEPKADQAKDKKNPKDSKTDTK